MYKCVSIKTFSHKYICVRVCVRLWAQARLRLCVRLSVYVCMCARVRARAHLLVCVCVAVYLCMYVCICVNVYESMWVCEHVGVCVCVCVCVHMCMCVCLYSYSRKHTYIVVLSSLYSWNDDNCFNFHCNLQLFIYSLIWTSLVTTCEQRKLREGHIRTKSPLICSFHFESLCFLTSTYFCVCSHFYFIYNFVLIYILDSI